MDTPRMDLEETSVRLQSVSHSLGLVIAAFVVGIALSLGGIITLGSLGFPMVQGDSLTAEGLAIGSALQFVGFILVGVGYLYWRNDADDLFDVGLPSLRDLGWGLLGLVSLFVAVAVLGVILSRFGIQPAQNQAISQGRDQPVLLLYLLVVTVLLTAPAEELIFRGLVQGLFRRAYGQIGGVVIASALFGVAHWLALGGTGSKSVYVFIAAALGLVLGSVYEKTKNLAVPILIHGVYNALIFYANYLIATGQIEVPA
jgi:membrane protease YdiL (CAAX protease family)